MSLVVELRCLQTSLRISLQAHGLNVQLTMLENRSKEQFRVEQHPSLNILTTVNPCNYPNVQGTSHLFGYEPFPYVVMSYSTFSPSIVPS